MAKSLAESFFTAAECQQVTAAVQAAEGKTSGEIVVLVTSASHHYRQAATVGGFILSLPLALLAMPWLGKFFWLGGQNVWMFLLCLIFFYLPLRLLVARWPQLKRFFLFTEQVEEEVSEAAMAAFYSRQLDTTRERNGVLLFISVLERRVFILADQGVNDKIDSKAWRAIVDDLTAAIRHGQRAPAVCRTIGEIGAALRAHFPIHPDDKNELHDLIIVP
ncbi:MAG: TPM domain-containing protein [Desulfobulbaceae bacterium]|jgi:putative membrane protein|nr:TPM domain-containing protein [Desulfobulbaceae bacterium]